MSFFRSLFGQVVVALVLGVVIGMAWPDFAVSLKPLGDGFIKLIKMVIAPLVFEPGVGMNIDPSSLDPKAMAAYAQHVGQVTGTVDFLLRIIPTTVVDAFAKGDILQVLLISIVFGAGLALLGDYGQPQAHSIERITNVLFKVIGFIVKLAPLGVLGAIAFTVGKYGIGSLKQLAYLVVLFYVTV